ncbi:MAG TPA: alpha/beta hydrolase [Burkholderiales bacterium]|nr:alpha/beta hydrolase [Burkholderiales bacterium]
MEKVYRGMTRPELDAAYNNRAAVPNFPQVSEERLARGRAVYARRRCQRGLHYGPGPRQVIDLILPDARKPAPVLAYIHGGYWQGGNLEGCAFIAEHFPSDGIAVALIEYTIAPDGKIGDMVAEISQALDWLSANGPRHGLDVSTLCLAGHSAGGHLTASAMHHPVVKSAIPISGLFDLEPIRLNYLNDLLKLTPEDVARYSPMRHVKAPGKPVVVAVGAAELPELVRQSEEYATALAPHAKLLKLAGHDHFSILDELAQRGGALYRVLGSQEVGRAESGG